MKKGIRVGCLFLLILGIQAVVFCNVDPLGYPDTIRYINFADFLQHPHAAHFGDLAHNNGILFTPLFLPFFLAILKKLAFFPYLLSGTLLQLVSFWLILWLAYLIALRSDGKETARLTLALLLTHLVFCYRSAFILTEYPFTAILLFIVFYMIKNETLFLGKVLTLSLLFGLLVSIRTQGFLFMAIIALYLLFSKKICLKKLAILCFVPLAYLLFYLCLYLHLNSAFPLTITMNEIFSLNSFFLGDNFAKYNFSVHGPAALVTQKISPHSFHGLTIYATLITVRISEFIQFLNTALKHYYPFFTVLIYIAFIFSKVRKKVLLVSLILLNFIITILFLTPYYAVLRYQASIFPLAMILIASCFVHSDENAVDKIRFKRYVLIFALLLYAGYFTMRHYDFFQSLATGDKNHRAVLRKETVNSARLITEEIGRGHNVAASDPIQYNIIYRSGNVPIYFSDEWGKQEILDYINIRHIRYFIGQDEVIDRLKEKGMSTRIICPILGIYDQKNQTFLCEFQAG